MQFDSKHNQGEQKPFDPEFLRNKYLEERDNYTQKVKCLPIWFDGLYGYLASAKRYSLFKGFS